MDSSPSAPVNEVARRAVALEKRHGSTGVAQSQSCTNHMLESIGGDTFLQIREIQWAWFEYDDVSVLPDTFRHKKQVEAYIGAHVPRDIAWLQKFDQFPNHSRLPESA